ncbi:MAG: DUF1924 domain-containing protein [Thiohalomonadaceae bacterium]
MKRILLITAVFLGGPVAVASTAVDELMNEFRAGSAVAFSAERGRELWNATTDHNGEARSCTSCHTSDLRKPGKHASTGKPIGALAPSVNPTRLTQRSEIEKWFGRNCKWTYGRVCTAEEKGHFLAYMRNQ